MFDPIQMQGIIRYSNRQRIKDEDLAQHSFSVAYYCFQICDELKIPEDIRNEAIAMAIIHDIGEVFTSDLPHDIKYANPELKELCDKLEAKYIDEISCIRDIWHKMEDNPDSVQKCIVKLADTMSVLAYCKRELDLGNNTEAMKTIYSDAKVLYGYNKLHLGKVLNII